MTREELDWCPIDSLLGCFPNYAARTVALWSPATGLHSSWLGLEHPQAIVESGLYSHWAMASGPEHDGLPLAGPLHQHQANAEQLIARARARAVMARTRIDEALARLPKPKEDPP